MALTLIAIPLLGLLALGLAVVHYPEEIVAVVRGLIAQEDESGLEDEEPPVDLVV